MKKLVLLFIVLVFISSVNAAIIADHNAVIAFDNGDIPDYWINEVKNQQLMIQMPGRSHAQQLVGDFDDSSPSTIGGLEMIEDLDSRFQVNVQCNPNNLPTSNALKIVKGQHIGSSWTGIDYECRNDDDDYWSMSSGRGYTEASADRVITDLGRPFDGSIFGWSFHIIRSTSVHNEAGSSITFNDERRDSYFNALDQFRANSPNTEYIYATAPTDQDTSTPITECGTDGERVTNYNQQIRDEAIANDGVLFDQADIEYHDANMNPPSTPPCGSGSTIQIRHSDWGTTSSGCTHSNTALCVAKGKAFWWMAARMAGWDGTPACHFNADCSGNSCVDGICQGGVSTPVISSVSSNGVLSHGDNFSISGSSFGVKSPVAPLLWDAVDNQYTSSELVQNGVVPVGGEHYWTNNDYTNQVLFYNGDESRIDGDWTYHLSSDQNKGKGYLRGPDNNLPSNSDFYVSFWYRFDNESVGDVSTKLIRVWPDASGTTGRLSWTFNQWLVYDQWDESCNIFGESPYYSFSETTQYHHMEVLLEYDGQDDCGDVYNNSLYIDNDPVIAHHSTIPPYTWSEKRKAVSSGGAYDRVWLIGLDINDINDPDVFPTNTWFDEVYIDNTISKIAIGDALLWDDVSHWEIQIPHTTWDSSSIQFTANQGSFGDEQLYLFVIDSEGVASNGVPVSFTEGIIPECSLTAASWNETEVDEGTQVTLTVNGNNCDGKQLDFELFDTDDFLLFVDLDPVAVTNPVSTTFSSGVATQTWITEWVDDSDGGDPDPEFVFIASLNEDADINIESSNTLKVSQVEVIIPIGCGNNVLNVGEQCDDGNSNDNDGCSSECLYVVPGNSQVHWVDQNDITCSDSGNGQSVPWCGLAPVDSHTFVPGDSVVFREGDYNRFGMERSSFGFIYDSADVFIRDSGTEQNPILIMAYPGEQVILRNEILQVNIPAWGFAVLGTKADYINVQGFTVYGTLLSSNSNFNIWRNNVLFGIDGAEPSFTGDGNYAGLMLVKNEHTLVRNNEFNNFDPEYETGYGNANGVQLWGYNLIPDPINNIIENNEFNNCFMGLFDKDNSRNNIHRKNKFYGSTYAMKLASQVNEGFTNYGLQVYQNLVESSGSGMLFGIGNNMHIHNNVFVNAMSVNPGAGDSSTDIEYDLYNSIIINTNIPLLRFNGLTYPNYMDYNLYSDFTSIQHNYEANYVTTLALWQGEGFDLNSIEGDPLFVDDQYHLDLSSPARGAGRYGEDLGLYPDGDESVVIGRSLPDVVPPTTYCGDGSIQVPNDDGINEVCDGTNFGELTCSYYGFDSGSLSCINNCQTIDTGNCFNVSTGCTSDSECNDLDNLPCTEGVCNAGTCEVSYTTNPCDDGIDCTEDDICSSGTCVAGTPNDSLCPDDPDCTIKTCTVGGCSYSNCTSNIGDEIFSVPFDSDINDFAGGLNGETNSSPTDEIRGFSFDGISNYVQYGDNLDLELPLSIASWVYLRDTTKNPIFFSDGGTSEHDGYWLYHVNGKLEMGYGNGGSGSASANRDSFTTNDELELNQWVHVVGIINGLNDMQIYIDGSEVSTIESGLANSYQSSTGSVTVGRRTSSIGGLDYLNGILEDLKVYDRALSSSEVSDLYNGNISPECTDSDGDTYSVEGAVCGLVDCNDNNATINPGASEICNGVDDDCDGSTVDGFDEIWFDNLTTCGVGECANSGNLECISGEQTDSCIVGDPSNETCNGLDDDCDGSADEDLNCGPSISQVINLSMGWNVVSLNLVNNSLTSEDLESTYVMRYNDGWETDWNGITGDEFPLEPLRGYYVYSGSNKSLTFSGIPSSSEYSLINNTWNLFSVNNTMDGNGFLVSVIDGGFSYDPVPTFMPGVEYWVEVGDVMSSPPLYEGLSFDTFTEWIKWLFSY